MYTFVYIYSLETHTIFPLNTNDMMSIKENGIQSIRTSFKIHSYPLQKKIHRILPYVIFHEKQSCHGSRTLLSHTVHNIKYTRSLSISFLFMCHIFLAVRCLLFYSEFEWLSCALSGSAGCRLWEVFTQLPCGDHSTIHIHIISMTFNARKPLISSTHDNQKTAWLNLYSFCVQKHWANEKKNEVAKQQQQTANIKQTNMSMRIMWVFLLSSSSFSA